MPEYEGGHGPGGVGAGAGGCGGGGALAGALVFDEQFHVRGGGQVDPAGVPGAGGEGVAEAGVGVEPEGQFVARGGGRGRPGGHGGGGGGLGGDGGLGSAARGDRG